MHPEEYCLISQGSSLAESSLIAPWRHCAICYFLQRDDGMHLHVEVWTSSNKESGSILWVNCEIIHSHSILPSGK